jgi:histidinol-phosphate aminotransferase
MSLATSEILASASNVYTWEPPDRVIAARYGVPVADILRFDLNTSPTAPDFLAEVLRGPFDPPLNEYPDSTYAALAEAAAAYVDADPLEILVGAGADEVLDIIAKTYLAPGAIAVVPTPTYSMFRVLSGQRGAEVVAVPRLGAEAGFALDALAMRAAMEQAAVVWLCSPNNPTGLPEDPATLEALLAAGAARPDGGPAIVVDEAYIEFAPGSVVDLRSRYPQLIVVRTLSKAFALPGLRIGYAVAARSTIARLERVRPPGSVSTVSATAAAAALGRPELAAENARNLGAEREWLSAALAADLGLPPYPSATNFVLCPFGDRPSAEQATEHLLRHGIVARTFGAEHPLADHLRFTVRDRRQDERLVEVLGTWMEGRSG